MAYVHGAFVQGAFVRGLMARVLLSGGLLSGGLCPGVFVRVLLSGGAYVQGAFVLDPMYHVEPLMCLYKVKVDSLNTFPTSFQCLRMCLDCQMYIQWNLSNLTHQGTRERCQIAQDVGKLRFSF